MTKLDSPTFQAGVTHAIDRLAQLLNVDDWHIHDGTETVDGDIDATIFGVLAAAKIYDDDTASLIAHDALLRDCKIFLGDLTDPDVSVTGPRIIASYANALVLLKKISAALADHHHAASGEPRAIEVRT